MRHGGTKPTKRPSPSTTAKLLSPCSTARPAASSWWAPGATTGGWRPSARPWRPGPGGEEVLDTHQPDEPVALEHRDVVDALEGLGPKEHGPGLVGGLTGPGGRHVDVAWAKARLCPGGAVITCL